VPAPEVSGFIDLPRDVLAFTGDQALWFCDQLLSNQVVTLGPGGGAEAMLLTPHGKIRALLRLLNTGDRALADMEPPLAAGILDFFKGRIFTTRVAIQDMSGDLGVVSVLGPDADPIVAALLNVQLGELPAGEEHANVRLGETVVARVQRPVPGLDLLAPLAGRQAIIAGLKASGIAQLTMGEYEGARVRAGVARDRVDFDETYLPQEAALERAVHFAKGCYLGQEAVAMTQRGRIKRRLRHLRYDADAVVGPVLHEGEGVGVVTSAGGGYGIAAVRTSVALGAVVKVGERPAVVEELPGTWTGPERPSARELRESLAGAPRPRTAP
jgi:folate-binding protein YgfZ